MSMVRKYGNMSVEFMYKKREIIIVKPIYCDIKKVISCINNVL